MHKILFSLTGFILISFSCNSSKTEDAKKTVSQVVTQDTTAKIDTLINSEIKIETEKQPDTIYIEIDKQLNVKFNNTSVATAFNDEPNKNLLDNLLKQYLIRSYTDHKTLPGKILYKYENDKAKTIFKNLDDAVKTALLEVMVYIEKKEKDVDLIKKYPVLMQTKFY